MRSSSWMISQLMSGSRLPVGSSAMIRRGSWTRARAMAVRCCSPPDSWAGTWRACAVRPTMASTRSTAGRIWRRGWPVTSSANATFSQTVLVGSSLKSWKMIPILRRILGTWRRGSRARSCPSSTTSPRVATSSRMSSLMSVDLPAPDGPTRNTKSPSGMTRSTSRSAIFPFGYCLVTSWSTRTDRSGTACGRPRSRMRRRSERAADGGEAMVTGDSAGGNGWRSTVAIDGGSVRPRPRARQQEPRRPRGYHRPWDAANGTGGPATPRTKVRSGRV